MRELLSLCPSFSVTDACLLCTTIAQPLYWNNGEDEALLLVPTTVGKKSLQLGHFSSWYHSPDRSRLLWNLFTIWGGGQEANTALSSLFAPSPFLQVLTRPCLWFAFKFVIFLEHYSGGLRRKNDTDTKLDTNKGVTDTATNTLLSAKFPYLNLYKFFSSREFRYWYDTDTIFLANGIVILIPIR